MVEDKSNVIPATFDTGQATETTQEEVLDYASKWLDTITQAMKEVEQKPEKFWVLYKDIVLNFADISEVIVGTMVQEKYRRRVNDLLLQFLKMSKEVMLS